MRKRSKVHPMRPEIAVRKKKVIAAAIENTVAVGSPSISINKRKQGERKIGFHEMREEKKKRRERKRDV